MNVNLFKKFKKNMAGSVTIEFAFMVLFLSIMLIFMMDLVFVRSTMGKLDSASYALVNLVKERRAFFGGPDSISQGDVDQLKRLGVKLLYGDNSKEKIDLVLEQLTHTKSKPNKIVELGDTTRCKASRPLADTTELSPYSQAINPDNRRQIPVYQVTICIEMASPFKHFLLNEENRTTHNIRSSSVAVSR